MGPRGRGEAFGGGGGVGNRPGAYSFQFPRRCLWTKGTKTRKGRWGPRMRGRGLPPPLLRKKDSCTPRNPRFTGRAGCGGRFFRARRKTKKRGPGSRRGGPSVCIRGDEVRRGHSFSPRPQRGCAGGWWRRGEEKGCYGWRWDEGPGRGRPGGRYTGGQGEQLSGGENWGGGGAAWGGGGWGEDYTPSLRGQGRRGGPGRPKKGSAEVSGGTYLGEGGGTQDQGAWLEEGGQGRPGGQTGPSLGGGASEQRGWGEGGGRTRSSWRFGKNVNKLKI